VERRASGDTVESLPEDTGESGPGEETPAP
jgi:hypothetical protein